jgi:uncharacterized protein
VIRRDWLETILVGAGRRPLAVFVGTMAVVGAALVASSRLEFDPDVLRLLPKRDPAVQTYRATLERFGSADYFVAAVRIPAGAPLDPYESYADLVVEGMRESGLFESIDDRLGEPQELLREFLPNSLLFLDAGGRRQVTARLEPEAIERRVQDLRRQLETPQAMAARELYKLDPLGLAEVFLDRLGGRRGPLAVDWTSGRYLSRDHRLLLVLGRPVASPQNLDFNRALVERMDAIAAAARAAWPELAEGLTLPPPEPFWGGRYVITLHDTALIWRDVAVNVAGTVVGVLVLFWLAYRRTSLLALVFAPLVCGLAVTFGFAALAVGKLASTTAGVAALLIGLGNDFVIVLYGRYVAERQRGAGVEASLRAMGGATARGVVLGAVTTAATFYAFLLTDFTGLYQMGLIVGTGILFCLVAVLLLVPAMIGWSEAHHAKREREPRLHLFAFGAEHLTRAALRWPRATLLLTAVATLAALSVAPGLVFEDSVEALRPGGNRGILAQEEINRHFGAGFDHMSLVVEAPTLEETLALVDRAAGGARRLVDEGRLGAFDAVTSVLPSHESQAQALAELAAGRASGALDPDRIRADFETACRVEGLRVEPFADGLELLQAALEPPGPVTRETVISSPQGAQLLDRYLRPVEAGWASVIKLYNLPGRPKREIPQAAVDLADALGPRVELTGINVMSRALRGDVRRDAVLSAAIGLVAVMILLAVDFRSWRDAALALVPLGLGIVWMIGAMVALDLHFNFMNLFVITMILGIGVDYGIHVIHRYLEERARPGGDVAGAVEETSRGVFLAALTTVVGFGSLATSHYPGLVSMGLVALLGAVATAIVAIAVVPAFLAWREVSRRRAGGAPR